MTITRGPLSALATVGSGTTLAVTWSGTQPAAGSKVLVWVQFNAASTFLTLTDNGTTPRTFTLDAGSAAQPGGIWLYRADNITLPGAGNYAVTITSTTTAGTIDAGGIAYTGVSAGGPTASNTGSNAGSTAVSSGSAAPAAAGALYFAAFSDNTSLNPETITLNWAAGTQQFVQTNGSGFYACAAADAITSGAQTAAWTLGDSTAWVAAIAVYDAASAPASAPGRGQAVSARIPLAQQRMAGTGRAGRASGSRGAPARNPVAGPVFRQAVRPAQARRPLPPHGRVASNPGGPVRNPVPPNPGPPFYPFRWPARIRITLPPRGRAARNPGAPVRNPHLGAAFPAAHGPVRAVIPQRPAGGRIYSNPGGPLQDPQGWSFIGLEELTYLQYLNDDSGTLVGTPDSPDVVAEMGPASGWTYFLPVPPADGRWIPAGGGPGFILDEVEAPGPEVDDLAWDPPAHLAHLPVPFDLIAKRITRKQRRDTPPEG